MVIGGYWRNLFLDRSSKDSKRMWFTLLLWCYFLSVPFNYYLLLHLKMQVVAKRWREASFYLRIALFFLFISVILFFVAFPSAYWVTKTYEDKGTRIYGLWKTIRYYPWGTGNDEVEEEYNKEGIRVDTRETPLIITGRDWYRATQALECLALICLVLALLIMLMYFCVPACKIRSALFGIIFFTFIAVIFIVIGVAIFGSKLHEKGFDVGWSMGLAIGGAVLAFISGIFQILELI